MGKFVTNVAQVGAVLMFMGWCASRSDGTSTSSNKASVAPAAASAAAAPPAAVVPPEKTTAARIARDFEKNEASAEDYYRDRCFDISGVVDHIDAGVGDDVTLTLRGGIMG